jgi:hypothetical protein
VFENEIQREAVMVNERERVREREREMKRLIVMEKESGIERVGKSETPGSVRRTCGQNHIPDRGVVHIATESYKKKIRH